MDNNYNNYTSDSISVLSDMQHVRLRPGMYVDSTDDPRQLLSEIIDNSLDEAQSGYSALTEVFVNTETHEYAVRDYGRGIPIGMKTLPDGTSEETLQVLTTKLFSGGKFSGDNYKLRGGLHGVGLGCCNALSEKFETSTFRDGKSVYLYCERGDALLLQYHDTKEANGVYTIIQADPEIYDTTVIPMDYIINRCLVAKAFGYPIDLYVDGKLQELPAESLADLIPAEDASQYAEFTIDASIQSGEFIKVVLRYTSETTTRYFGYTNLIFNRYGGTHTRLIDKAIEEVWKEYYDESDEVELRDSDCKIGLRVLCAVFISEVAFSSQTKDKLTVKNDVVMPLIDAFKVEFKNTLESNPDIRKALIKRFAEYRQSQNRLTARKEIMELVKINGRTDSGTVKRKSVVRGLIECTSPLLEGTQLYLVEGNSAGGCFTGDTKVRLANGESKAIKDIIDDLHNGIKHYTYSSDEKGKISIHEITSGALTIHNANLVKVILDDGSEIRCTPDHPFLLRTGEYCHAEDLQPGVSLMACRFRFSESPVNIREGLPKYEFLYDNYFQKWRPTHHIVAYQYYTRPEGKIHIHHKDFDSLNNYPENIEFLESLLHRRLHAEKLWGDKEFRELKSRQARIQMSNPEYYNHLISAHRELMKTDPEYRSEVIKRLNDYWAKPESRIKQSAAKTEYWESNPEMKSRYSDLNKNQWIKNSIALCNKVIEAGYELNKANYQYFRENSSFQLRWSTLLNKVGGYDELVKMLDVYNHKVVSVEYLDYTEDVYDITVGPHHNFLLDAGVFVHNTAARARDKKTQSVLPLRGKVKNITYMSINQALKSEDIRRIVNATGAGVGDETDPDRCRYEKIILSCDADPDGSHITALLLSVYINLMPNLVKAGRVYVLKPPLFGYIQNKHYVFTDEFEDIPEKLRTTKGYTRYKGLGEMDDDEFKEACMTPGQQRLYQVLYPEDIDEFNRIMGTTGGRRDLLVNLGIIRYIGDKASDDSSEDGEF